VSWVGTSITPNKENVSTEVKPNLKYVGSTLETERKDVVEFVQHLKRLSVAGKRRILNDFKNDTEPYHHYHAKKKYLKHIQANATVTKILNNA